MTAEALDSLSYQLCSRCDHFVDRNDDTILGLAEYLHLENGEQEFDHEAEPNGEVCTLAEWKALRPDLFVLHPDGAVGPNSSHHGFRGKVRQPLVARRARRRRSM